MAYTPCILIGLGGTGTAVVERVRKHVIAATRNDDEHRELLVDNRFQFIAVDTTTTLYDRGQMPRENYHAVTVQDGDGLVDVLREQDSFFREWWYLKPDFQLDYYPGPIILGAGTVPIKGRLAYVSDQMAGGDSFHTHLDRALGQARNIWQQSDDVGSVMVYLVGSLCGGTGSGLFMAVAHHARRKLGRQAHIIGVLATASTLNLVAEDRDHISANCCAGLNSLDLWLDPNDEERELYTPFYRDRDGSEEGDRFPMSICYLITRWNRDHSEISKDVNSYLQLMADGIFSEIMGPASAHVQERFADFLTQIRDRGTHGGRPVQYGSFGVSGLRYDNNQITDYCAVRFSRRLLDRWFLSPRDVSLATAELARRFMEEARIRERESYNEVIEALTKKRADMVRPVLPDITESLMDAGEAEWQDVIEESNARLDKHLGLEPRAVDEDFNTLGELMERNAVELYESTAELLDSKVMELLRGSDDGFEVASNFIRDLSTEVKAHSEDIRLECDGDRQLDTDGYREDLEYYNELKPHYMERIREAFESKWISDKTRKKDFMQEWWEPYRDMKTEFVVRQNVLRLYRRLLARLELLDGGFERLTRVLESLRNELAQQASELLGKRRGKGSYVLEAAILDSADHADRKFLRQKDLPEGYGIESMLTAKGAVITQVQFLWGLLEEGLRSEATDSEPRIKQELRKALLERGRKEFSEEVGALSLWDALELEAKYSGRTTSEAIKDYVEDKIRKCARRCAPAWQLREGVETGEGLGRQLQYHGELTYNVEALGRFESKYGAVDLAALVSAERGRNVTQIPAPDPHRLMMRVAEGRAPLYALEEATSLVDKFYGFRGTNPEVPLYVDSRYRNLPMRLLKPERESGRLVLLLGEFLSTKYPGDVLDDLKTPIMPEEPTTGAYWWAGDTFARSRTEAYDKMHPHEDVYQELHQAVQDVWNKKVTPTDRKAMFDAMARWFERRRRQRSGPIKLLLKSDVGLIKKRADKNPDID